MIQTDQSEPFTFGLIAATFTPFGRDGELDLASLEPQAQMLVRDGVRGVFVCGTTGEGTSLTSEERMRLAARWCEVAGSSLEVIVHVGHASLAESCRLATHAQRLGAAGVAALPPYFLRPGAVHDLVACCAQVAQAAPDTPFFYYHIPSLSGVSLSMADFLEQAHGRIPNLGGVKFTHEDLMDMSRAMDAVGGRYEVMFGRDEILLAGLSLGARSAVGSTYNLWAPLYRRVLDAFERGDHEAARQAQRQARELVAVAIRFGGLPAFKAMMRWKGIECGPCRLPLLTLSPERERELELELERRGLLQPAFGVVEAA